MIPLAPDSGNLPRGARRSPRPRCPRRRRRNRTAASASGPANASRWTYMACSRSLTASDCVRPSSVRDNPTARASSGSGRRSTSSRATSRSTSRLGLVPGLADQQAPGCVYRHRPVVVSPPEGLQPGKGSTPADAERAPIAAGPRVEPSFAGPQRPHRHHQPGWGLMFQALAALADSGRDLIRERTHPCLEAAGPAVGRAASRRYCPMAR